MSFEKYVPNHLIRLLYKFYFIFRRHYLIIKKTDSENEPTQINDFERMHSNSLIIHRGNVLHVSNES